MFNSCSIDCGTWLRYVTGLPDDITKEEMHEFFRKVWVFLTRFRYISILLFTVES